MKNMLSARSWSPYAVGAGIGVLSWLAFASADHPLGVSTAFETTAALGFQGVAPSLTEGNSFFQEHTLKIGWVEPLIKTGDFGEVTLPEVTGITPWLWIAAAVVVGALARFWQAQFT